MARETNHSHFSAYHDDDVLFSVDVPKNPEGEQYETAALLPCALLQTHILERRKIVYIAFYKHYKYI